MQMKSTHAADSSAKGITGAARSHITSRLHKATGYAKQLVELLRDPSSGANETDLLEARAYAASLAGAVWLEKRRWEKCLGEYAVAKVIYTTFGQSDSKLASRELVSSVIDPSLRYAAYQMKLPRSKSLSTIALEYFPPDATIRAEVERAEPGCLSEEAPKKATGEGDQQIPESVTWRTRPVPLEDASIAQAIAASSSAGERLASWLTEHGHSASAKDKAAAYDSVISASQDAVDATRSAVEDLANEGVSSGEQRMQTLQVIRTAVHYTLVGWRVGRNRILCGDQDGVASGTEHGKTGKNGEHNGKRLTRVREKVALYDSILQNVDLILELPGIAADTSLVEELTGQRNYFRALRYVAGFPRVDDTNIDTIQMPRSRTVSRSRWQVGECTGPLFPGSRSHGVYQVDR